MSIYEKVRKFFEEKVESWYIMLLIFLTVEIINYGFLSLFIPWWACNIISLTIIGILIFYIATVYQYLQGRIRDYMKLKEESLNKQFQQVQQHIDELHEENIQLKKELHQQEISALGEKIKNGVEEINVKITQSAKNNHDYLEASFATQHDSSVINNNVLKNIADKNRVDMEKMLVDQSNAIRKSEATQTEVIEKLDANHSDVIKQLEVNITSELGKSLTTTKENLDVIVKDISNLNRVVEDKVEMISRDAEENHKIVIDAFSQHSDYETNVNRAHSDEIKSVLTLMADVERESKIERNDVKKHLFKAIESNREVTVTVMGENQEFVLSKLGELQQDIGVLDANVEERVGILSGDLEKEKGIVLNQIADMSTYVSTFVEGKIEVASKLQIQKIDEMQVEIKEDYKKVHDSIIEADRKSEQLSSYIENMQLELTKLMVQLLDDFDEDSEALRKLYDRIFKQIIGLSQDAKQHIHTLTENIQEYERKVDVLGGIVVTNFDNVNEEFLNIHNELGTSSGVMTVSRGEINSKLENLQIQILNLNALAGVIKNISETQLIVNRNQVQADKKDNRVEEIKDATSGIKILNHYENKKIVRCEMYTGQRKNYEVEYDGFGRIIKSKNFDSSGNIITELQYYNNGQVKTRTENVTIKGKKQTVVSEFDEQGNKIK